jgi:phosphoribosylanthranilate isomerase
MTSLELLAAFNIDNMSSEEIETMALLNKHFPKSNFKAWQIVGDELVGFYSEELKLAFDLEDGNHDHSDAWWLDVQKQERLEALGITLYLVNFQDVSAILNKIMSSTTTNITLSDLKLKVCGMRDPDNIAALSQVKPDYMGFIFYELSKRFVGETFMFFDLDPTIQRVGVFVDASEEYIMKKTVKYFLNAVQLHGNESVELCKNLHNRGVSVIKVFSIADSFDFSVLDLYKPYVDFFLFDTKGKEHGGNGFTFDWSVLRNYDGEKPFFLSGGIGLEEITQIGAFDWTGLNLYALDVNSCLEKSPGLKDIEMVEKLKGLMKAKS